MEVLKAQTRGTQPNLWRLADIPLTRARLHYYFMSCSKWHFPLRFTLLLRVPFEIFFSSPALQELPASPSQMTLDTFMLTGVIQQYVERQFNNWVRQSFSWFLLVGRGSCDEGIISTSQTSQTYKRAPSLFDLIKTTSLVNGLNTPSWLQFTITGKAIFLISDPLLNIHNIEEN